MIQKNNRSTSKSIAASETTINKPKPKSNKRPDWDDRVVVQQNSKIKKTESKLPENFQKQIEAVAQQKGNEGYKDPGKLLKDLQKYQPLENLHDAVEENGQKNEIILKRQYLLQKKEENDQLEKQRAQQELQMKKEKRIQRQEFLEQKRQEKMNQIKEKKEQIKMKRDPNYKPITNQIEPLPISVTDIHQSDSAVFKKPSAQDRPKQDQYAVPPTEIDLTNQLPKKTHEKKQSYNRNPMNIHQHIQEQIEINQDHYKLLAYQEGKHELMKHLKKEKTEQSFKNYQEKNKQGPHINYAIKFHDDIAQLIVDDILLETVYLLNRMEQFKRNVKIEEQETKKIQEYLNVHKSFIFHQTKVEENQQQRLKDKKQFQIPSDDQYKYLIEDDDSIQLNTPIELVNKIKIQQQNQKQIIAITPSLQYKNLQIFQNATQEIMTDVLNAFVNQIYNTTGNSIDQIIKQEFQ